MKYKLFLIMSILFLLILNVKTVNATTNYSNSFCVDSNDGLHRDCTFHLDTTGSATSINKFDVTIASPNIEYGSLIVYENFIVSFKSSENDTYTFSVEYIGDELPIGSYDVFKVRFNMTSPSSECNFSIDLINTIHVNRKCTIFEGYYFDGSGNKSTTKTNQYRIDCETITCEVVDEHYFDSEGNEVNEEEYSLSCNPHTCEYIGGYYFDGQGNKSTTKTNQYRIDCETITCEKVGNNYYDSHGNHVSLEDYVSDCNNLTCIYYNGKYYDKNGNMSTTKTDDYRIGCEKITCEKVKDNYYDKDGNKVSEEEYSLSCETHKCEYIGGYYFDGSGNKNSAKTSQYRLDCEKVSCEIINDKYYDKDGKETTQNKYEEMCLNHCKVIDGIYYDNKGNIVSSDEYTDACSKKDNPETGIIIPLASIITLSTVGILTFKFTNKKKAFR